MEKIILYKSQAEKLRWGLAKIQEVGAFKMFTTGEVITDDSVAFKWDATTIEVSIPDPDEKEEILADKKS